MTSSSETATSAPIRPPVPLAASHQHQSLDSESSFTKKMKVEDMWELLTSNKDSFSYGTVQERQTGESHVQYLSRLSKEVKRNCSGDKDDGSIVFFDTGSNAPAGHPTMAQCRPDFVAAWIKPDIGQASEISTLPDMSTINAIANDPTPPLHWSQLEATGQRHSSHKSRQAAGVRSASYTEYLLQARPDLVSVLGIYVDDESFVLYLTNASNVFQCEAVEWVAKDAGPLLCAWIWRLYHPCYDATITRVLQPNNRVTFNVKHQHQLFEQCTIKAVGSGFSRRTIVFASQTNNKPCLIKEQYLEPHRFKEGPILRKIHSGVGRFPGVVHFISTAEVPLGKASLCDKCIPKGVGKTRMVMPDDGAKPLMEVETPLDVLIALYDILEITRLLHRERRILHRDISSGNVMVTSELRTVDEPPGEDLKEMCFASYMLREKIPGLPNDRFATKALLIDFDLAQDLGSGGCNEAKPRTGTPIFMAREVLSGKRLEGSYVLYPIPMLDSAKNTYKNHSPMRFEKNWGGKGKPFALIMGSDKIKPFLHKLRYDAESVFWLLLYWCIQAQPKGTESDPILYVDWVNLHSGNQAKDTRAAFVPSSFSSVCAVGYQELDGLLALMSKQLVGTSVYHLEPSISDEEYLHEVFQRIILEFLVKNIDKPFMKLQKDTKRREVEPSAWLSPSVSNTQDQDSLQSNKRSRSESTEEQERSSKKPKIGND